MRHIVSILLQNEAGALARVANMFAARGYNIESLTVAPTHDPLVSRVSLVTTGSDAVIEQIVAQTRKLIDVVSIADLSSADHLECELVMHKVEISHYNARAVIDTVRAHRASILDESDNTRMVQLSGTGAEVESFLAELTQRARIVELVRSGVAALARGQNVLTVP